MSAGARLVRPPKIRRSRVKQGEASEPCKARGRNRANVRLHVREMSAGARLVRPPEIRRSRVKQRAPVRGRAPRAPARAPRPPGAADSPAPPPASSPAVHRPLTGAPPALAGVCRRGPRTGPARPPQGPATSTPATLAAAPERPASRPSSRPHWLFTTEMHPITLGRNRGFLGARIGSRPTSSRLRAEKSPTAAPIGRPEASTIPATRAPGARGATKNGGAHNACPRRLFPNVQPDKCSVCLRELAGFRRARGVRRKTGGRTTHARADFSRTCSRTNADFRAPHQSFAPALIIRAFRRKNRAWGDVTRDATGGTFPRAPRPRDAPRTAQARP